MITDNNLKLNDEEMESVSGGKSKGEEYHDIPMPMSEYGLIVGVFPNPEICIVEVESTGARVMAHFNGEYTIGMWRRVTIEPIEGSNTWMIVEVLN